jgi:hypothetical protein
VSNVGKGFLRQFSSFTQFTHASAESLESRMFRGLPSLPRHSVDAVRVVPIRTTPDWIQRFIGALRPENN